MVKVTIVIPIYNVEKYVARCIDSCINQSFEDIEIICVNDGSTDNSQNIIEHYQKLDSRVKIINKENGGLSSARNAGANAATGKYILFVDSDDFISTNTIERLYNNAEKNSSDLVIFDYVYAHINPAMRNVMTVFEWKGKDYENTPFNLETAEKTAYLSVPVTAWCKLYRTDFLKENNISFEEGIIYEDVPYQALVLTKAQRITYVAEPFYYYYVGRGDQIMAKNDESLFDVVKIYQSAETTLKNSPYFEKCKDVFYIMLIRDFLIKLKVIKPELLKELYTRYKEMHLDIDYKPYETNNYIMNGSVIAKLFKELYETANYEEFLKIWNRGS